MAAQGDIIYFNGTQWVSLPAGNSGDVLTSNGVGSAPSYETPSGGPGGGLTFGETQILSYWMGAF